jgi:protein-L-isoaspartate(D-aspartate) O-methyltransferase
MDANTFIQLREWMVQTQVEARGIRDAPILAAMRKVPREKFVPESLQAESYEDNPLPIEEGQTISQPYMVALMAQALKLTPNSRVLEVGAGSGYAAAVLGQIAKEVYAIEYFPLLAELAQKRIQELGYTTVHLRQGDGNLGWKEHAPFQAITVAAAAEEVPPALLEQLDIGGRLVIPIGPTALVQELMRITKKDKSHFDREMLGLVRFVPLLSQDA